jgi:hypothetical protein
MEFLMLNRVYKLKARDKLFHDRCDVTIGNDRSLARTGRNGSTTDETPLCL